MKVLVIGVTGHVGSAAAAALGAAHEVVGATRSGSPRVDIDDPASIERLFAEVGTVDAVICAVGHAPWAPLADLARDDYIAGFLGKALAQIDIVRIGTPYVADGGSITLTTGILARRPVHTGVAASMANGAVESFVRGAAAEMERGIRLNAVSPTVLQEATEYHEAFGGFDPVPARVVGEAFREAVEGGLTGHIFEID